MKIHHTDDHDVFYIEQMGSGLYLYVSSWAAERSADSQECRFVDVGTDDEAFKFKFHQDGGGTAVESVKYPGKFLDAYHKAFDESEGGGWKCLFTSGDPSDGGWGLFDLS